MKIESEQAVVSSLSPDAFKPENFDPVQVYFYVQGLVKKAKDAKDQLAEIDSLQRGSLKLTDLDKFPGLFYFILKILFMVLLLFCFVF